MVSFVFLIFYKREGEKLGEHFKIVILMEVWEME